MKPVLMLAILAVPAAAHAQAAFNPQPTMNEPNYSTFNTAMRSYDGTRVTDTPAMQRQKYTRAVALRAEARQLAEADGGTLSPANLRYIQRKADAIRAGL